MPIDPRLQTFLEQAGFLKKPGSAPRRPEVLLVEERESAKQALDEVIHALRTAFDRVDYKGINL